VHGAPEKSAYVARKYLKEPRGLFQSFSGNIVNRCFYQFNGEEGKGDDFFFKDEFQDLMREIGIEPPHCMKNFCCANFVVHKSRIQFLSKDSWKKLLFYSLMKHTGPGWRNNCYHLEHFWHMFFGEPSHTYKGWHPNPEGSAWKILRDSPEEKEVWEGKYREYLKPPRASKASSFSLASSLSLAPKNLLSSLSTKLHLKTDHTPHTPRLPHPHLSPFSPSRHLVIVRWNENLTWVSDYFSDTAVTVVQKANDENEDPHIMSKIEDGTLVFSDLKLKSDAAREQKLEVEKSFAHPNKEVLMISNTKRVGRECSGYIYYILQNYDNLPTWIEFVHGAPEKSATIAYKYLHETRGDFQSFSDAMVNRCFEQYVGEEGKKQTGENFLNSFMDVLKKIGIKNIPHCIKNFCCANFVVHKSRILAISREGWEYLLQYSVTKTKETGWKNNCYHLEHFWHLILGEPSHTYFNWDTPNPESSAGLPYMDTNEDKKTWRTKYVPFLKPKPQWKTKKTKK